MSPVALRLVASHALLGPPPFARQCQTAAALGFDGVQWSLDLASVPGTGDAEARELREAASAHGLAVAGVQLRLDAGASLSSEAAIRDRLVADVGRACQLAALAGGRYVAWNGALGASVGAPVGPDDDDGDALASALVRVGEAAAAQGVLLCIAPAVTGQATTVAGLVKWLDRVQLPSLRVLLDPATAWQAEAEPLEDLVHRWVPDGYLAHVELQVQGQAATGPTRPGLAPLLRALLQMQDFGNWDGVVAVEASGADLDAPATAALSAGFLRGVEQGLRA